MPTVLIVEDDPHLLKALVEILTEAGYQVRQAHNGQQGLQLAQSLRPDLILCDIVMPELDGNQMVAALHHLVGDSIPIIGMSAKRSDMTHGSQHFVMFLRKPFSNSQLIETTLALIGPAS